MPSTLLNLTASKPTLAGRDRAQLAQVWGEWLDGRDWHHFLTLTARFEVSPERLQREFGRLVDSLPRMTQGPVCWFYAIENLESGQPHIHALLARTQMLKLRQIERGWRLGHSDVRRYDPTRRGSFYVTKQIGSRAWDWFDHSRQLPPTGQAPLVARAAS